MEGINLQSFPKNLSYSLKTLQGSINKQRVKINSNVRFITLLKLFALHSQEKIDAELSADQKSALRKATVKAKAFQEVIVPRGRGRPRKDAGLSTPQPKKNGTRTKVPDTA